METSNDRLHSVSGKMGDDCISSLPDSVMCHILSRLPIKDVVRTSILSTNWIYRWTSIYDINVCYEPHSFCGSDGNITRFRDFIFRVLDFTCDSKLRSFRLSNLNVIEFYQLKGWIYTILSRNVEILYISARLRQEESMFLPQGFSNCASLRELKLLLNCTLRIDTQICFPNLKHLCLGGENFLIVNFCIINGGFTGPMLMIFPVLEVLELSNCRWLYAKSVEIRTPKLTKLKVVYSKFGNASYSISIFAPRLATFELPGYLPGNFVVNAPDVTYAALVYEGGAPPTLTLQTHTILNWFSHLNHLKLSSKALKDLMGMKLDHCSLPNLHQLQTLELSPQSQCYTSQLFVLLDPRVLPSLESLYMNLEYCREVNYELHQHSSPCIAPQLREIKFTSFRGAQCENHLVSFFLRNGERLKKASVSLAFNAPVTSRGMTESHLKCNLSKHLPKLSTCVLHVQKPV